MLIFQFSERQSRLAAVAFALTVLIAPHRASAADPAETFVAASIETGTGILNHQALNAAQRETRFREFLASITDMQRIGLFTLGSYARNASKSELDAFNTAFTGYLTAIYQRGLAGYSGQTLHVTGSVRRSQDDSIVNAEVVDPDGRTSTIAVAFRVRKNTAGQQILTDLQVEGMWLAVSKRSDFTAYLQQHHGDIGQLSSELDRLSDRMKSETLAGKSRSAPNATTKVAHAVP